MGSPANQNNAEAVKAAAPVATVASGSVASAGAVTKPAPAGGGAGAGANGRKPFGLAVLLSEARTVVRYSPVIGSAYLPEGLAYGISKQIGRARFRRGRGVCAPLVKEMKARLGASQEQAEKSVERLFELTAYNDLELWRAPRLSRKRMDELVEFRGLSNLDQALEGGRGAILCTGHLRSLITFFVALSGRGYKINAVRRSALQIQGPIGRWLVKRRTLVGNPNINFLWMNASSLKAAVQVGAALRRNEIVVFLIDVRYGAETVPVEFLGEKKMFPSGHVSMSQATGAPLIDFFAYHPDGSHRQVVEFQKPFHPSKDIVADVQQNFSSLESKIVKYPADWLWFSERELWKNPND
jgi:KDO2-lipid IV(A) lauroyltransferase